jgi:predicted acylesterase/phospholipase RssA
MVTQESILKLLRRQPVYTKEQLLTVPAYAEVDGAGGIKGYAEIGAKQAIEDLGIRIGVKRGVSVGAANATLSANGFSPRDIFLLYERERERLFDAAVWQRFYNDSLKAWTHLFGGQVSGYMELWQTFSSMQRKMADTATFWQQAMVMPSAMQWMKSQSFISLEKLWTSVIEKEQLSWQDDLEIVAYCMRDGHPLYLRSGKCPLNKAVAGSGSLPGVFAPVEWDGHLLGDGAMYHYNPTDGLLGPVIVIRLGRATEWSNEVMNPLDAYYLWREINLPMMPTTQDIDESKHIVVDIPCKSVAGLAFGASDSTRFGLIEEGYRVTYETLSKAIVDGRIKALSH